MPISYTGWFSIIIGITSRQLKNNETQRRIGQEFSNMNVQVWMFNLISVGTFTDRILYLKGILVLINSNERFWK